MAHESAAHGTPPKVLPDCEGNFRSISQALHSVSGELAQTTTTLRETRDDSIRQQEQMKSLWKELREDIMPQLRAIPEKADAALSAHAEGCPARQKAMARARGEAVPDSDPAIDTRRINLPARGEPVSSEQGGYVIPRVVLWVGATIGIAIAVAGWAYAALTGAIPG